MKFKELPLYLEHELKNNRIENMRSALAPFIRFTQEEGKQGICGLLENLQTILSKKENIKSEDIVKDIQQLNELLPLSGLADSSPNIFYRETEVYYRANREKNTYFAMMINSLFSEILLKIIKKRYGLLRSYSKQYFVKDIKENGFVVITNHDNCIIMLENGIPPEQIVSIDFCKVNRQDLKKDLRLPIKIKDLEEIFVLDENKIDKRIDDIRSTPIEEVFLCSDKKLP